LSGGPGNQSQQKRKQLIFTKKEKRLWGIEKRKSWWGERVGNKEKRQKSDRSRKAKKRLQMPWWKFCRPDSRPSANSKRGKPSGEITSLDSMAVQPKFPVLEHARKTWLQNSPSDGSRSSSAKKEKEVFGKRHRKITGNQIGQIIENRPSSREPNNGQRRNAKKVPTQENQEGKKKKQKILCCTREKCARRKRSAQKQSGSSGEGGKGRNPEKRWGDCNKKHGGGGKPGS